MQPNELTNFQWRYSPSAVSCSNVISDAACNVLYPGVGSGPPGADEFQDRPLPCYTTDKVTPAAIVEDVKRAAIASCPKNCGYCCLTPDYKCSNVACKLSKN